MARVQQEKHAAVTTGSVGTARHSLRSGFNGVLRALPGDQTLLSPSVVGPIEPGNLSASLGASGPHDFAVRNSAVRPHASLRAATQSRPPQSHLTCRDHRAYAPLHRGGMPGSIVLICPTPQAPICAWRACGNCPSGRRSWPTDLGQRILANGSWPRDHDRECLAARRPWTRASRPSPCLRAKSLHAGHLKACQQAHKTGSVANALLGCTAFPGWRRNFRPQCLHLLVRGLFVLHAALVPFAAVLPKRSGKVDLASSCRVEVGWLIATVMTSCDPSATIGNESNIFGLLNHLGADSVIRLGRSQRSVFSLAGRSSAGQAEQRLLI
jgi:hypothetical protein